MQSPATNSIKSGTMTKKWKSVKKKPSRIEAVRPTLVQPLADQLKKPYKNGDNKRTTAEIAADELLIEHYAVRGYTEKQIAEEIGKCRRYTLSSVQVHYDLKKIKAKWIEESQAELSAWIAKEIKGLEWQEVELVKAWEKSKLDAESETRETIEVDSEDEDGEKQKVPGEKVTKRREGQSGWVAFQNAIMDIRKQRRELLGLDKPTKVAATNLEGTESYQPLVIAVTPEEMPKARKKG